jgi:molybdenum cofactor cytidylyltransferase
MNLLDALDITPGDVVTFVGAGGKTSAMARLARECADSGLRVLVTTTTRIAADELALFAHSCDQTCSQERLRLALGDHRVVFCYTDIKHGKATGIAPGQLADLIRDGQPDMVLIEGDGARRLALKAPYAYEPVVPQETTLVVNVAGFSAWGRPLTDAHVYNAKGLAARAGVPMGTPVDAVVIAAALTGYEPQAEGKIGMRVIALLNQVARDDEPARAAAERSARAALAGSAVDRVLVGSVQSDDPIYEAHRRVVAVVLAAGMSTRMGTSKALLPWGARTVIAHVAATLIDAGMDDIRVITGADATAVEAALRGTDVRCVYNPDYAAGEMLSSLKAGLRSLREDVSAVLVALGDQPMMRADTVRAVMHAYAQGRGAIIAPSHNMRRGHPILIDRRFWQALLDLPSDGAPRNVINRHARATAYVDCDESVLGDIDTPEAYAEALRRAKLT